VLQFLRRKSFCFDEWHIVCVLCYRLFVVIAKYPVSHRQFLVCACFLYRQSGPKSLDAMFGKARCIVQQKNFGLALDLMNQVVVTVSNFLPAIIEKMKFQLAMHDWEQVVDSAQRYDAAVVVVCPRISVWLNGLVVSALGIRARGPSNPGSRHYSTG